MFIPGNYLVQFFIVRRNSQRGVWGVGGVLLQHFSAVKLFPRYKALPFHNFDKKATSFTYLQKDCSS